MSGRALRRTGIASGAVASVALGLLVAAPTQANAADVSVKWDVVQDWGSGYQVQATITNNTSTPIDPWRVSFPYETKVTSIWDAQRVNTNDGVRVSAPQWQTALAPGASASFGLIGSAQAGQVKVPSQCDAELLTCRVNGGAVSESPDEAAIGGDEPAGETPQQPAQPQEPTEPQQPAEPGDSTTPAEPGDVATPAEPGDSTTPTAPGDSTTPAEPGDVATPAEPGDSTTPAEPGDSTTPAEPGDVATPAEPGDSTTPAAPGDVVPGAEDAVISVSLSAASDWGSGRTMGLKVTNESADVISDWSVSMPWAGTITSMWNAKGGVEAGILSAANESWNGRLDPGNTVAVGFGDSGTLVIPDTCTAVVAGATVPCEVSNEAATTKPAPVTGVAPGTTTTPGTPTTPVATAPGTPTSPDPATAPAEQPQPVPADPSAVPSGPAVVGERKVIGYYPAWGTYGRKYQVADIPAQKVTHINYAFANISGGKCVLGDSYADVDKAFAGDTWDTGVLRGNFNQLIKLREANPHLQTMISLGGWTWSSNFSEVAATPQSRKAFVDSCVDFMEQYKFDGIDVDWEYPVSGGLTPGKPEDKANYTLLMQEFRAALDAEEVQDGRDYWLSIAAPAGPSTINNLEVAELAATMDWINLMTYDFHGGWENVTGHNAPMTRSAGDPSPVGWSVTEAVQTYLDRGVPAQQLVVGVPFYGRGWNTDGTSAAGLFQSGKGTALGTWEAGVFDYTDLSKNYLPNMTRYWDEQAQVPYLFDPQRKLFISYDDPQSIAIKAQYINDLNLGGAMFWEFSGDRDEELLDALNATLE